MTNTSREVGGVVGIALLGTVLFDRLGSTLLPKLAELGLTAGQASAVSQAASHGFVSPLSSPDSDSPPSRSVGSPRRSRSRT